MGMTTSEFIFALINIVFLDLVLAGDNAIVIGLAARNLPSATQKKAIIYGTGGAVVLRIIATILVVWLLNVPWLMLIGGILLVGIAYKLLTDENDHTNIKAGKSLGAAIRTIIVADAAMGLDNVIAVAGAANHNTLLVIIGLLISVPIIVWGSTLFIKLINRFPWIIYIGAAILGFTASSMITGEQHFKVFFESHTIVRGLFIASVIMGILIAGYYKKKATYHREQTSTS